MTRSHDSGSHRGGRPVTKSNAVARRSQISRTLSKLLRHQAENEKLPITKDGWVYTSDLLAWRGLKDKNKFDPAVTLEEIFDVVEDDGQHGKGRFGLKLANEDIKAEASEGAITGADGAAAGEALDRAEDSTVKESTAMSPDNENATKVLQPQSRREESSKNSPETILSLRHLTLNPTTPASSYLIRATQGHSIKSVESEGLLTPISLDDPSSIPNTVVHGTFYGAWDLILSSGGLKPMGRNMVHFATGPTIREVYPELGPDDEPNAGLQLHEQAKLKSKQDVEAVLSKNKVVSGMRWDAQILIYIDLKRLLNDVRDRGWDMKWFRSDNGVLLTAGLIKPPPVIEDKDKEEGEVEVETESKSRIDTTAASLEPREEDKQDQGETSEQTQKQAQKPVIDSAAAEKTTNDKPSTIGTTTTTTTTDQKQLDRKARKDAKRASKLQPKPRHNPMTNPRKPQPRLLPAQPLVPTEYFSHVVEIKAGLGLIYKYPEGVVRTLPNELKSKGVGFGKGGHMAQGQRGKKIGGSKRPGLNVERGDDGTVDVDIDVDVDVAKGER